MLRTWNFRNSPPLEEVELQQCIASARINGIPRTEKVVTAGGGLSRLVFGKRETAQKNETEIVQFGDLHRDHPRMKAAVVEGLFRQGETANLISATKAGKSWLVYDLALSIITGRPWLEQFNTCKGKVLLIDNELHRETLANRIPRVAEAKQIFLADYAESLDLLPLRGNLLSWVELQPIFEKLEHGYYRAVLFDAKYRFSIPGVSENENAADALVYNMLDQYAEKIGAGFVLVHHSSKGSQSDKRVTDVGAGAGAQSRAADCHIVLREHEEDNVFVLDAAVRSFPPVQPLALRWNYPLWHLTDSVDPRKLRGKLTASDRRQAEKDREGIDQITKALGDGPATASKLRSTSSVAGKDRLQRLLDIMTSQGVVTKESVRIRGNNTYEYSLPKTAE